MITRLSDEALELADALERTLAAAEGVGLLRAASTDPSQRQTMADSLIAPSGAWELSPLDDQLELEAAAAASRAVGRVAFPYPVVERIAHEDGAEATALIGRSGHRMAEHVDLPLDWSALDLTGRRYRVTGTGEHGGGKLGRFASVIEVAPVSGAPALRRAALLASLQQWWLLGLLDSALSSTVRYAGEREQFGRRLRAFQGVSFQLAESSVEVRALDALARYTLWSVANNEPETALTDAVALRVAGLRAAGVVLHTAHQVHGAMGFTDEVDVSWLSRASQSVRRLPEDAARTVGLLHELVAANGFEGLPGAAASAHAASRITESGAAGVTA